MKDIREVKFHAGSKEELLPDFTQTFPYIATRVEMDHYPGRTAPWHWHGAVELSYTQQGCMEYHTPGGMELVPAGTAVLVNANVLHMTTAEPNTVQLLHIFDPAFLALPGSRISERYITPLAAASQVETLCLRPDDPVQNAVLRQIKAAFSLTGEEFGYELTLKATASNRRAVCCGKTGRPSRRSASSAAWAAAVILERPSGTPWAAPRRSTAENGRILILRGRNGIALKGTMR